jgi:hypothetical protein
MVGWGERQRDCREEKKISISSLFLVYATPAGRAAGVLCCAESHTPKSACGGKIVHFNRAFQSCVSIVHSGAH